MAIPSSASSLESYPRMDRRGSRLSAKKIPPVGATPVSSVVNTPSSMKRRQPGYPFEFRVVLQGGKVRRGDSVRLE